MPASRWMTKSKRRCCPPWRKASTVSEARTRHGSSGSSGRCSTAATGSCSKRPWRVHNTGWVASKPCTGQNGHGVLAERGRHGQAVPAGSMAWHRTGVAVSQMRTLPCSLYSGEVFDKNVAVVLPRDNAHLPAIWCFCSSPYYHEAVRRIDKKINVTNATLVKVPFDLDHWSAVARHEYPNGLP